MLTRRLLVAAALFLGACASAPEPRIVEAGEPVTAFTGVTIITEYGGERLSDHTVAVRGDRIIAIAPDNAIVLPEGVTLIDGAGRYVAPGITDMHVHYAFPDAGVLFLANSITTVRNPSGGDGVPQLIAATASGATPGPFMYSSGQLIDGPGSFWGPQVVVGSTRSAACWLCARVPRGSARG
jgi:imidazolonepropionase-like amidohydrolase